ncbi:hypothetical protein [Sphingomonas echinoides]|uniref:hypothetical protein n=1 Tax=Sphingomonas echinoides TaxID=59803 RepID=UPI00241370D8|nr:hypothetical protein [Sphingomonas echinoides]
MTLMLSPPDPSLEVDAEPGVIILTGHGTTVTADALRTQFVIASDCAATTAIDASEMLSVGQAVLQLLIAARRDAALNDHPYHFTAASAAFTERVLGCQLADAIGLDAGKDISL